MKKTAPIAAALCLLTVFSAFAQTHDLNLSADDVLIEHRADGGFHLFVRRKPDINSVLLVESTRDPRQEADNYSFRANEWNAINGDEIRILNGVRLTGRASAFSLVSSTVVDHPRFGQAFHIYIPYIIYYGFPPGRHGRIFVIDGTFFNIRTFALPHANYDGPFADNPFVLEATQMPTDIPEGYFMRETIDSFREIAGFGRGDAILSAGGDALLPVIRSLLERENGNSLDIVICFDTTGSMVPHVNAVRQSLIAMLEELNGNFPSFRVGMVQFKDYFEEYLTRVTPFTTDFPGFQRVLNNIRARGGGDIPEAVYEGLFDSVTRFNWEADSRLIILIGDAPPHPRPRGRITRDMVAQEALARNIVIHSIAVPPRAGPGG
ncbi:MAG: VWA domain-containing protein [Spirochaetes bacterium]|nr:VWA domain-containing protein [Spirochaetota bacterium]